MTVAARHVAVLAAVGIGTVEVRRRLKIAVLTTGAELVPAGEPLGPGQIYNSNGIALAAAATANGAEVTSVAHSTDDTAAFSERLDAAITEADVVVTSGGVSMGDFEVVRETLIPRGGWFHHVAMQPGGPQGLTVVDGTPVLSFPGNPVSTLISFEVFVRPILRRLAGLPALASTHRPPRLRPAFPTRQTAVPPRPTHRRRGRTRLGPRLASHCGDGARRRPHRRPGRGHRTADRRGRASVGTMSELTHLDSEGRARMVDVSAKVDSARTAVAAGEFVTSPEVIALVRADDLPKADVLATARIAGIGGAKRTSELIPLCHQLALSSVKIAFGFTETAITIEATAKTRGPTGVEMEALTAVAVAGLTLHDMVKAVDPAATLTNVRLLTKQGGKSGHWTRMNTPPPPTQRSGRPGRLHRCRERHPRGQDRPGDRAMARRQRNGSARPTRRTPMPTSPVASPTPSQTTPALVISTGGTGASPTDATPEATLAVLDRELPGVAEAIRAKGAAKFPHASLSRGVAGLAGRTVLINLPGSPGGVRDGLAVLDDILDHLLAQVAGGGAHE